MNTTGPTTYAIRVDGHLDDHWSGWLGGLTLTRNHDGTSTLTGPVADQAQLHGILAGLRDIGATLLDLRATGSPPQPNTGCTPSGSPSGPHTPTTPPSPGETDTSNPRTSPDPPIWRQRS